MKKDIKDRKDIELLVNRFYEKVQNDEIIAPFFNEVVKVNWKKHLPIMYDFWENVLFFTGKYEGNPMAKHQAINRVSPLKKNHFLRWQNLFTETVNEYFQGNNAKLIIKKASNIGDVMQVKLNN